MVKMEGDVDGRPKNNEENLQLRKLDETSQPDEEQSGGETKSEETSLPLVTAGNVPFKKPNVLIGPRRGILGRSVKVRNTIIEPIEKPAPVINSNTIEPDEIEKPEETEKSEIPRELRSKDPSFVYVEPPWGGKLEKEYSMEVLKSGVIAETISLSKQSFYVIGRLPSCDIVLAHPTISRYHAVLQYRSIADNTNPEGLYIYDLGSTHGTFWNGSRIKYNIYVRVHGGHMIKFGCSQRKYILQAPLDDQEEESQYSITELKERRILETKQRQAQDEAAEENKGIDWGMGEDADESTDLQENPYACTVDEDLLLDDPKKSLRGWFEREGYDLQYLTEERGVGQFLCWVDLPLESITGRSVRAEALVKGKKKESVVQCALEACRILDKYGLLRQANHEARKRKTRNWEEEDYYDSDEDNYLDRTGSVEKKREQRMRLAGKLNEKVETYESLLEKHKELGKQIALLSNSIKRTQKPTVIEGDPTSEDALDAYMSTLNSSTISKSDIAKMKVDLQNLRKEEASMEKLLNLTRPADLPALVIQAKTSLKASKATQEPTAGSSATKQCDSLFDRAKIGRKKQIKLSDTITEAKTKTKTRTRTRKSANTNANRESMETAKSEDEAEDEAEDESEDDTDDASGSVASCIPKNSILKVGTGIEKDEKRPNDGPYSSRRDSTDEAIKERKSEVKAPRRPRERLRKTSDQETYGENYSTWVPPQNQDGDGKTSLNAKYGY